MLEGKVCGFGRCKKERYGPIVGVVFVQRFHLDRSKRLACAPLRQIRLGFSLRQSVVAPRRRASRGHNACQFLRSCQAGAQPNERDATGRSVVASKPVGRWAWGGSERGRRPSSPAKCIDLRSSKFTMRMLQSKVDVKHVVLAYTFSAQPGRSRAQ